MQSKIKIQNQIVKITVHKENYVLKNDFANKIERELNKEIKSVASEIVSWEIVESRYVKINNELFLVDNELTKDHIESSLRESQNDLKKMTDDLRKQYYIENLNIETIDTISSKTILLREDKEIDKSAYNVPLLIDNFQIQQIIKSANKLWLAIDDDAEVKEVLDRLPIKLSEDNFKIGGEYMDDFHSIFTVLLKEFGIKFQPTEANVFQC